MTAQPDERTARCANCGQVWGVEERVVALQEALRQRDKLNIDLRRRLAKAMQDNDDLEQSLRRFVRDSDA